MERSKTELFQSSVVSGRNWWRPRPYSLRGYISQLAFVFLFYFAAGELGLAVPFTSANVSLVWLAAGVGLAAVLMWGGQMFPAIALAAFLVNYPNSLPLLVAVAIGVGSASQAVAGGYLLSCVPDFQTSLRRLRDVLRFALLAAVIAAGVAPSVGITALSLDRSGSFGTPNDVCAAREPIGGADQESSPPARTWVCGSQRPNLSLPVPGIAGPTFAVSVAIYRISGKPRCSSPGGEAAPPTGATCEFLRPFMQSSWKQCLLTTHLSNGKLREMVARFGITKVLVPEGG